MSEAAPRLRIRVSQSPGDDAVAGFLLETPMTRGETLTFEPGSIEPPPLAAALLGLEGVERIEIVQNTIWLRKASRAEWSALKPAVAAAIREAFASAAAPLGTAGQTPADPDARLLRSVEGILREQVNPSVAAHGGKIEAVDVTGGTLRLRMTGGCQGCAASSATLRQGVERILRAALPELGDIVDVTDHASGDAPYLQRGSTHVSPLVRRLPEGTVTWTGGKIEVDPAYLAPRLGLAPEALQQGLRSGAVVGVTETGQDKDAGKTRIVMRSAARAWAAEIHADGSAYEVPPPTPAAAASAGEAGLAQEVRTVLEALPEASETMTYGELARKLGLWAPGSIGKVTRALEQTMREDAASGRPFLAARAVSRTGDAMPGRGFFELAATLGRGMRDGENEADYHRRTLSELAACDPVATRP